MEKVMKVYETPVVEIVEMELQDIVCASTNDKNVGIEDSDIIEDGEW